MNDGKLAIGNDGIGSFLKFKVILIGDCDPNQGCILPLLAFVSLESICVSKRTEDRIV
jgi:hypothetical protein